MKNYVKEEATDLDEDEFEAKKDLFKTKMSIWIFFLVYAVYYAW